jgi:hypothetical protein
MAALVSVSAEYMRCSLAVLRIISMRRVTSRITPMMIQRPSMQVARL